MTRIGGAEREAIDKIQKLGEAELRLAMMFQTGLPVPGWWRWDTGDMGYSLEFDGDSEEISLSVLWHRTHPGMWRWHITTGTSAVGADSGEYYRLAYDAVMDATKRLHELFPDVNLKKSDWMM
jgi:hypothetical protein